jgi:hypothetical protein
MRYKRPPSGPGSSVGRDLADGIGVVAVSPPDYSSFGGPIRDEKPQPRKDLYGLRILHSRR